MPETIDNSQWPWNSLLVSTRHRVIYTPIAKNANTTLKRLFVRLSGHPRTEEILRGSVHDYLVSHETGLSLCDYSHEDANRMLRDEQYFRFAVLRNPLDRVVSGYLEKFVISPQTPEGFSALKDVISPAIEWVYARRDQRPDYERSITFSEFAEYVAQNRDRHLDTHFKSQSAYLERQKLDFLGTLERMDPLIGMLESRFDRKVELEWENRTARRRPLIRRRPQATLLPAQLRAQRRLAHSSELLTPDIAAQLNHRYAQDLKLWRKVLG